MRITKIIALLVPIVLALGFSVIADDSGTVSLIGKNVDISDTNTMGITLTLANKTWKETEPGSRNHFFATKSGIYVKVAPNLIILRDKDNKTRIGQLNPLEPEKTKKGDKGRGLADETGIAFTWEVM